MSFEIESDVPMVSNRRGRKAVEFPFGEMDVGDSFLVPCDVNAKNEINNWRRKIAIAKKAFGQGTFSTATVGDGIRVWRTA
jgi:hypothetical protein